MPRNALLVRWNGGWHEVVDTDSVAEFGRSEALLGLGALGSVAEVERVGADQLAIFARPRTEIAADYRPPADGRLPYADFAVGDTVIVPDLDGAPTRERLTKLTVSEDDDGMDTYAPELADVILTREQRWEQAIKKMSDGTLRGQSAVATPAAAVGALSLAPAAAEASAPATSGGATAWAVLAGTTTTNGEETVHGPTASSWYQSPGIDAYVSVTTSPETSTGHYFAVSSSCDLRVTLELDTALGDVMPESSTLGWGIELAQSAAGATVNGATSESHFLTYTQFDFPNPSASSQHFDLTTTARIDVDPGSGAVLRIAPLLFDYLSAGHTFDWRCTLELLERSTARTLPSAS